MIDCLASADRVFLATSVAMFQPSVIYYTGCLYAVDGINITIAPGSTESIPVQSFVLESHFNWHVMKPHDV